MITQFNSAPDIMITKVINEKHFYFQYWQREGKVNIDVFSPYIQLALDLIPPSTEWVTMMNVQFMALELDMHLSLINMDARWWVLQPISSDWQYGSDQHGLMAQHAIAEWLEIQANKQTVQANQPGVKV